VPPAAAVPAVAPAAPPTTGFDLRVTPTGTKVSLDGVAIGLAPLRVRNLSPGRHTLDIEAPHGYFSQHVALDVAPGEALELSYTLDPLDPPAPARAPARRARSASSRRPAPSAPSAAAAVRPAPAASAPSAAPAPSAPPAPPAAPASTLAPSAATGTLMLGSKPPCEIAIDGRPTGLTTPQASIPLPAGIHSVTLTNRAHGIDKRFRVRIAPGKMTRAVQDLLR
jgi:hypothetical protein